MNNEPVAWWTGEFNDEADDFMFDKTKQNHMNHINSRTHEFFPIPLYTHPVKGQDGCGNCHACLVGVTEHGLPVTFQRMILCPDCGNKRCPKASNHRHQCTESNEPNQRGSIYTHPVKEPMMVLDGNRVYPAFKELTDEEIDKLAKKFGVVGLHEDAGLYEFAKAILRKAQEK
jgi:hypothetical protein